MVRARKGPSSNSNPRDRTGAHHAILHFIYLAAHGIEAARRKARMDHAEPYAARPDQLGAATYDRLKLSAHRIAFRLEFSALQKYRVWSILCCFIAPDRHRVLGLHARATGTGRRIVGNRRNVENLSCSFLRSPPAAAGLARPCIGSAR